MFNTSTERDLTRIITGNHGIPVLPPTIEGKTYFNKAWQRRIAMKNGTASEPSMIEGPIIASRPRTPRPEFPGEAKDRKPYHWNGSRCVKSNYERWKWPTRDRVLDGEGFHLTPASERCVACNHDFENA